MKNLSKKNIEASLVIACFIVIITYLSQFILLDINKGYRLISVLFHSFDSLKGLPIEIVIVLNILADFLFYFITLLLGFKIFNDKNILLKYLILSFIGIIIVVLLFVSSINIVSVKEMGTQVYKYLENKHFIMYYLLMAIFLLFIPLAFKNNEKIIRMENEKGI